MVISLLQQIYKSTTILMNDFYNTDYVIMITFWMYRQRKTAVLKAVYT